MTLRVARNAAALAVARGGTMLLKLGVAAHLTRVLAPEGFGVLGYGLALVSFFGLLGSLGLDVLGTRQAARQQGSVGALTGEIVGLRLALSSAAFALYGLTLAVAPMDGSVRTVLLVQGVIMVFQSLDVEWLYRGIERMGPVAVRNVVADALQLAGVLLFVRSPEHLLRAALITTGAAAIVTAGMWASYRRDFGVLRLRLDLAAWRKLLRPALPLATSALMITVYYSSGRLFLGWLRGVDEVGQYEAAYRLMGVVLAPSQILYQAFFPSLAQAFGDVGAMRARGQAFAEVMVAVGLPLAALVAVSAAPLIVWFAGTDYAASARPLMILMVTAAVTYVNIVLGQSLLGWNADRPYLEAVALGAVLNVALNVALIPTYGATGAALATFASEVAALLRVAVAYRVLTKGLPWIPLGRATVTASAGAAATWALLREGTPLAVALVLGGMVVLGATFAVGTIRPHHVLALIARARARRFPA